MRHLRPVIAFLAIALLAVACSSPSASQQPNGSNGGEESQAPASEGGGESQPEQTAAPGGNGGGANGSVTYQITGGYEASGELPFLAAGISTWIESEGGWVANFAEPDGQSAYILINSQTQGQIFTFGDGAVLVVATSDESSGYDCTFEMSKNDSSGLAGSVDCSGIPAVDANSGATYTVDLHAEFDGHN